MQQNETYLCFVDDLLIFSKADQRTVEIIMNTLWDFANLSGLRLNPSKSVIFVSNSPRNTKNFLVALIGFQEGALPVMCVGVPLVSKTLRKVDCNRLVESVMHRITHWMS